MMKADAQLVKDEAAPVSFGRPKVVTQFTAGYVPPFDVVATVEKMLETVPPKYLNGLSEVVLTNTAGLSRKQRRSMTKSRGRKVKQSASAGLYFQAWNGRPAWIQIYVDNTLRNWERGFWLKLSFYREMLLGEVLFHEIGHHIHATVRPEHREAEDVADAWKLRIYRNYLRQRHPILKKVFRIVTSAFGPYYRRFYKRTMEQGVAKGWMSRAECDESMKIKNE
jgi:hypothetical protein